MLIHWSQITPGPLKIIDDAPICNAGIFSDITQFGDVKSVIIVLLYFVLDDFESSIAEYHQYGVLNYSRKRILLTHYQEPVIYTAVCHWHTSDI